MAFSCGFYDAIDNDRVYSATQFGEMFDGLITDGVYATIGNAFAVVPGVGVQVKVRSGRAWFNKTWSVNTADLPITLAMPDLLLPRIDAIVLEIDTRTTVRNNSIKAITGSPNVNPTKPTLTRSDGLYQYPLAWVRVDQNVSIIAASKIENNVGKTPTPFVTGILKGITIDELWNQWEGEFDDWFQNVQAQLEGDIALNLQRQVEELKSNKVNVSDKASNGEAIAATNNTKWMTPSTTKAYMTGNKASTVDIQNGVANKWVDAAGLDAYKFNKDVAGDIVFRRTKYPLNGRYLSLSGNEELYNYVGNAGYGVSDVNIDSTERTHSDTALANTTGFGSATSYILDFYSLIGLYGTGTSTGFWNNIFGDLSFIDSNNFKARSYPYRVEYDSGNAIFIDETKKISNTTLQGGRSKFLPIYRKNNSNGSYEVYVIGSYIYNSSYRMKAISPSATSHGSSITITQDSINLKLADSSYKHFMFNGVCYEFANSNASDIVAYDISTAASVSVDPTVKAFIQNWARNHGFVESNVFYSDYTLSRMAVVAEGVTWDSLYGCKTCNWTVSFLYLDGNNIKMSDEIEINVDVRSIFDKINAFYQTLTRQQTPPTGSPHTISKGLHPIRGFYFTFQGSNLYAIAPIVFEHKYRNTQNNTSSAINYQDIFFGMIATSINPNSSNAYLNYHLNTSKPFLTSSDSSVATKNHTNLIEAFFGGEISLAKKRSYYKTPLVGIEENLFKSGNIYCPIQFFGSTPYSTTNNNKRLAACAAYYKKADISGGFFLPNVRTEPSQTTLYFSEG